MIFEDWNFPETLALQNWNYVTSFASKAKFDYWFLLPYCFTDETFTLLWRNDDVKTK